MIGKSNMTEIKLKISYILLFDDIIIINDFNLKNIKVDKNCIKIFLFTTLDMKHQMVENLSISILINQIDLLEIILELNT